jgi:hypothetical protein
MLKKALVQRQVLSVETVRNIFDLLANNEGIHRHSMKIVIVAK